MIVSIESLEYLFYGWFGLARWLLQAKYGGLTK